MRSLNPKATAFMLGALVLYVVFLFFATIVSAAEPAAAYTATTQQAPRD